MRLKRWRNETTTGEGYWMGFRWWIKQMRDVFNICDWCAIANLKRTTKTGPLLQKQTTWYILVLCVPGWFNGEVIPILGFGSMCMSLLHLSSSQEFFPNLPLRTGQAWDRTQARKASSRTRSWHEKRLSKMQGNDQNMNLGPKISVGGWWLSKSQGEALWDKTKHIETKIL